MSLRVTQTPRLVHRAAHASSYAASPNVAALIPRSRLDNFVGGERIDHTANAYEAVRTLLRSWHTPQLPQRHAPREQSSAAAKEFAHGVSQIHAVSQGCGGKLGTASETSNLPFLYILV